MFGPNVDLLSELRRTLPPRFVIDGPLGAGGQGSVFRGTVDGTAAALKAFMPTTDRRRVEREIEALQAISCAHVVRVLAFETVTILSLEVSVVAYELHPGGDLRDLVEPAAVPLASAQLARIGREIGSALDELWARRIVHRDVKPANIVRAADGHFVLVDLGLARHIDRSAISGAGTAPGTPGYMSPEQAQARRNLTIHADAFSLGVTLRYLATKTHPFAGQQANIMARLVPKKLHSERPDLDEIVCRSIDRLMAFRPSQRPNALGAEFPST